MMLSVSLRLTGSQNSFNVFQIELLGGHLYNNYSLTSDLLFYSMPFYIDTRILIESATVAITILNDSTTVWLTCHFFQLRSQSCWMFQNASSSKSVSDCTSAFMANHQK